MYITLSDLTQIGIFLTAFTVMIFTISSSNKKKYPPTASNYDGYFLANTGAVVCRSLFICILSHFQ